MDITLERPNGVYYKQRQFRVVLNGKTHSYIGNSEQNTLMAKHEDVIQVKIDSFTGGPKVYVSTLPPGAHIKILPVPFLALYPLFGVAFLCAIIAWSYMRNLESVWVLPIVIGVILISYIPYLTFWNNRWLTVQIMEGYNSK